jgi:hypothetical protein
MIIRGIVVSAALLTLAPDAMAGEQTGVFRRASCTVVRYYVAKYSAGAAEAWARSHGASEAEIEAARRCIVAAPAATQARAQAPQTVGWVAQ